MLRHPLDGLSAAPDRDEGQAPVGGLRHEVQASVERTVKAGRVHGKRQKPIPAALSRLSSLPTLTLTFQPKQVLFFISDFIASSLPR